MCCSIDTSTPAFNNSTRFYWCSTIYPAGTCQENQVVVTIEFPDNTHFTQFRLVQHEHGGGDCNCWSVDTFVVRLGTGELLSMACENVSISLGQRDVFTGCDTSLLTAVTFCGGSASVPRGFVTVPYLQNPDDMVPCDEVEGKSVVIDSRGGPVSTGCPSYPSLNFDFSLDLLNDGSSVEPCIGPQNFDAGVELAISNNGLWVPLLYFAPSNERIDSYNIAIDREREQGLLVNIRGYTVPVIFKANSNRFSIGIFLCEEFLQEGAQLRWLQTAAFTQNVSVAAADQQNWRDVWLLDDVTVALGFNDSHSVVLVQDTFDGLTTINTNYWNEPVRNGMITQECSTVDDGEAIVFGTLCTTPGCGSGEQITASRLITTSPLSFDELLGRVNPTTTSPPVTQTITNNTTPPATTLDQFEIAIQAELLVAQQNAQSTISTDSQLAEIENLPPEAAVRSLREVISERDEVNETVVTYLLGSIVMNSIAQNISDPEEFAEIIHSIGNTVLKETMRMEEPNTVAGSTILSVFEQLGNLLLQDGAMNLKLGSEGDQIQFLAQRYNENEDSDDVMLLSVDNHSIRVPADVLQQFVNGTAAARENSSASVFVVLTFYRNMSGLLPGNTPGQTGFELASPVLASSLLCGNEVCDVHSTAPITITVSHSSHVQGVVVEWHLQLRIENAEEDFEVQCVFWEFTQIGDNPLVSGSWSTEGCVRNDLLSDSTQTVCQCTHLTNFAILLSAQPLTLPAGVALSLSIIGYIGVSLSVVAMLATIAALVFLKSLWNIRNFVHINLCVSLILAQLTFVIGVTPHGREEGVVDLGCQTAAVLMHYLFLVSFMWMLMEGVVLYLILVRVFITEQKKYMIGFFVFSYGVPLLYMMLCVPLGFALYREQSDYGYGYIQAANETAVIPSAVCWLNPHTNFVLTFIVPVVVVLMLNIGFFIMAIVVMYRHARAKKKKIQLRQWLKLSIALTTVMGLAWLIGVVVFEVPALLPLSYIFTIFVAFQGVAIFVIFVPLSEQVRMAYSKWWKDKVAASDTLRKRIGKSSSGINSTLSTGTTQDKTSSIKHKESSFTADESLNQDSAVNDFEADCSKGQEGSQTVLSTQESGNTYPSIDK